jgi:hypothetical protein
MNARPGEPVVLSPAAQVRFFRNHHRLACR